MVCKRMTMAQNCEPKHTTRYPVLMVVLLVAVTPWMLAQVTSNTAPSTTQSATPDSNTKSGSKDDLNAVGSRKIGGKGFGNWYSLEHEISLGKEYAESIESNATVLSDPVIVEYVNRLGQNLVRNSDAKVPFTIKVIDSDELNAFALPGGFMYVNTGAIMAAHNEAELAAIMAHEIAHVAARHATRQLTRSQLVRFASVPLIFAGGGVGFAISQAARVAAPLTMMKFSRGFEKEADYLGLQYLYKTGYDPEAFVSFFERVEAQAEKKPGKIARAFSTHPQISDRIKTIQDEIARLLPGRELYILSSSEFEDVKAYLTSIQSSRRADERNNEKPTLRRRNIPTTADDVEENEDDEPPTLKRRKE